MYATNCCVMYTINDWVNIIWYHAHNILYWLATLPWCTFGYTYLVQFMASFHLHNAQILLYYDILGTFQDGCTWKVECFFCFVFEIILPRCTLWCFGRVVATKTPPFKIQIQMNSHFTKILVISTQTFPVNILQVTTNRIFCAEILMYLWSILISLHQTNALRQDIVLTTSLKI